MRAWDSIVRREFWHGCDSEWQGIEGQLSGEEDDEILDVWTRWKV